MRIPSPLVNDGKWDEWNKTLETKMRLVMLHFCIDPADVVLG
jgi:hypothetical protein